MLSYNSRSLMAKRIYLTCDTALSHVIEGIEVLYKEANCFFILNHLNRSFGYKCPPRINVSTLNSNKCTCRLQDHKYITAIFEILINVFFSNRSFGTLQALTKKKNMCFCLERTYRSGSYLDSIGKQFCWQEQHFLVFSFLVIQHCQANDLN